MNAARDALLQSLIEKMGCLFRGTHANHKFSLGEFSLGKPQITIIFFLSHNKEGVSVKDLAKYLNVTSGAITQFITGLAEKNLVQREEDPNDRRLQKIKLTEFAETKFQELKKKYIRSVSHSFENLKDEELEQLVKLFSKAKVPENWKITK